MKNNENEKYKGINVLIYGSGGRQALPMSRGFYELGCTVTAYCSSKIATGYLTKFVHQKLLYDKNNSDKKGFFEYGVQFIKSGKYDLVVPLGDEGAIFLSKN